MSQHGILWQIKWCLCFAVVISIILFAFVLLNCQYILEPLNSLRPSDAIWRQWSWTTLAQVMACCLTAPSHYLKQCWLIIRGVLWHTSESSFAGIVQGIDSGYEFEKDILKHIFKSPRGQWVNCHCDGCTIGYWLYRQTINGSKLNIGTIIVITLIVVTPIAINLPRKYFMINDDLQNMYLKTIYFASTPHHNIYMILLRTAQNAQKCRISK